MKYVNNVIYDAACAGTALNYLEQKHLISII